MTALGDRVPVRVADIREKNERLVLGMVWRAGVSSQSEVALASGLKASTVFRIFNQLERRGLISAARPRPAMPAVDRKGRKPMPFAPVPGAFRVAGLDFRAGAASVVVEDFASGVLLASERPLSQGADAEAVYGAVSGLLSDALDRTAGVGGPLLGIGIGAPGVVDMARGRVADYQRIPGLSGFPLSERLSSQFGSRVLMGNNATVAALAAYRYGQDGRRPGTPAEAALGQSRSACAILIRSGVGGAFIQGGKPYDSAGRTALEIGRMVMDPAGPSCGCGGCLEASIAEDELVAAVDAVTPCADFDALDRLVSRGEAAALAALRPKAACVAWALGNLRRILDPDAFMIITRSEALSAFLSREVSLSAMFLDPGAQFGGGREPVVAGYRWDPILAGRAACDMVFDDFFS